jgi:hypothetical protein
MNYNKLREPHISCPFVYFGFWYILLRINMGEAISLLNSLTTVP